jgi:hypothetical protein
MPTTKETNVNWGRDYLKIERLDCKTNPKHFKLLIDLVIKELTKKVITKRRLQLITSRDEICHFVRESVDRYDSTKYGNIAWYSFVRLRVLVHRWDTQFSKQGSKRKG